MRDQWGKPLTNASPRLGNPFASPRIINSHFLSPVPVFPDYWLAYSPFREAVKAGNLFWYPYPWERHSMADPGCSTCAEKPETAPNSVSPYSSSFPSDYTFFSSVSHKSEHRAIIAPCSLFLALVPALYRTRFPAATRRPLAISLLLYYWLNSTS